MAYLYENLPVLSKLKIGDQVYYLKDADVRAILDTFGNAVVYNVDNTVTADSANLATQKAIAEYVASQIGDLASAMNFRGAFDKVEGKTALEVLAANVVNPVDGDVALVGTAEYVYSNGKWVLFGDEGVYATIAGVEAEYVKKTLTIAGIDLKDAITAAELKTALGLKALAYKDSASGTIEGLVTAVNDAQYTPAGSVTTTVSHTSTNMESTGTYTPAGTITGNVTAAGSISIARDDVNGVAVSGTVSAPTITVTPNTAEVQHLTSVGELPSYTAAQYVAPSVAEASAKFAAEGMMAAVEDGEMLVFTAAAKADALTGTGFNAGSYTAAEFNAGSLPVLGNSQTVVTGIASASATAPVFSGDKFGAAFSGSEVAITASFAGTEGDIAVAGLCHDYAVKTAEFVPAAIEVAVGDIVVAEKNVTVQ